MGGAAKLEAKHFTRASLYVSAILRLKLPDFARMEEENLNFTEYVDNLTLKYCVLFKEVDFGRWNDIH